MILPDASSLMTSQYATVRVALGRLVALGIVDLDTRFEMKIVSLNTENPVVLSLLASFEQTSFLRSASDNNQR
jgi:hypothetical protein